MNRGPCDAVQSCRPGALLTGADSETVASDARLVADDVRVATDDGRVAAGHVQMAMSLIRLVAMQLVTGTQQDAGDSTCM